MSGTVRIPGVQAGEHVNTMILPGRRRVIDEQLVAAILRGENVRPRKDYGACRNPACGEQLRRRTRGRGYAGGCGYCLACYDRWVKAGRPASGPPPARHRGGGDRFAAVTVSRRQAMAARMEDYAGLRSWDVTPAAAAGRVGIRSAETIARYEAAYQASRREAA